MSLRISRPFAALRLPVRSLSTTPARFYPGPEDKPKDAQAIEEEKQKTMKGDSKSPMPEVAPKWNPEMATSSEAAVKAEHDPDANPQKLAEKTTPKTK